MDEMDLTRAMVGLHLVMAEEKRGEEKKRRQSNCLPRVTVTFCLVPGKGAVLTLPGYAGEGDGVTGSSHVCSKSHNTLTEMALSPGT